MTSLFFIIFARLFYVQVIWGEKLQSKAIDQWTREIPVIANRGKILDRNGVVLADNKDTYTVFLRKKAVKNMDLLCSELSKILDLEEDFVKNRLTQTKSSEVSRGSPLFVALLGCRRVCQDRGREGVDTILVKGRFIELQPQYLYAEYTERKEK